MALRTSMNGEPGNRALTVLTTRIIPTPFVVMHGKGFPPANFHRSGVPSLFNDLIFLTKTPFLTQYLLESRSFIPQKSKKRISRNSVQHKYVPPQYRAARNPPLRPGKPSRLVTRQLLVGVRGRVPSTFRRC